MEKARVREVSGNINGIHHVTAIARDPQKNLDFYAGVLGLRLVKKTVNFDDPYTYHFYFGDEEGRPGTLLTFFPWPSADIGGRKGTGQLTGYSFAVPQKSLDSWKRRLNEAGYPAARAVNIWGEEIVAATDHDGFEFELVASGGSETSGSDAITGLHGVRMSVHDLEPSARFLSETMGFGRVGEKDNVLRFGSGGSHIDVMHQPDRDQGVMGTGIIHHVAWRTPNDATQVEFRDHLLRQGQNVTPVIDRSYFHSIYFRDPGGAIFEVATDPPGFMIDESASTLGMELKLPSQYEAYRAELENALPPVVIPVFHENTK